MFGMLVGAVIGLVVGLALSLYVARLDLRKRQAGLRIQAQYRLSLVVVPVILAGLGAALGAGIAQL
jgi:ABC-type antimicrobial peptide transport system permease subunit